MSNVGPTTDSMPVPMKKGVLAMCNRVTCKAVAMPVVMNDAETRYSVVLLSKLKAPPAIANGGEKMDPTMHRACCKPSISARSRGTSSFKP